MSHDGQNHFTQSSYQYDVANIVQAQLIFLQSVDDYVSLSASLAADMASDICGRIELKRQSARRLKNLDNPLSGIFNLILALENNLR